MIKNVVKWLLLVINIGVALCLLFALLAAYIHPQYFILPSYFALIFPVIFIINGVFFIFWLIFRSWYFLLSFCFLLLSIPQLKNNFSFRFKQPQKIEAEQPITLLSYNTRMMGLLKKHEPKENNKVLQYVLTSNADIVCLQEFMVSPNEKYLTEKEVLSLFNKYPYHHIYYRVKQKSSWLGIATFSKFPIVDQQAIAYASSANASIFTDINIHGKIIRIINNHLESNQLTEKDKALPYQLKKNIDTKLIHDITLVFSKKLGTAYKIRASQADSVAVVVKNSPYPLLVCGDFNDVPGSYAYCKIKDHLNDSFLERGKGFGWTFIERYYRFRIDYIFHDSFFQLVDFKIDKVRYSDHYPLQAKFSI